MSTPLFPPSDVIRIVAVNGNLIAARGDTTKITELMSLLSARTFRTASAPDPQAVETELAAMTLRLMAT